MKSVARHPRWAQDDKRILRVTEDDKYFSRMNVTIVGAGRLGTALAKALKAAGVGVAGPLHRGDAIRGDVVLLAVPDREIVNVVKNLPTKCIAGHTAGAITLEVFGKREAFSMHPLMTAGHGEADFTGASAAIAGTTE